MSEASPEVVPVHEGQAQRPRWIYPAIAVGLVVLMWNGISERDYWREVVRQKSLFPARIQRKVILDEVTTTDSISESTQ